MNQVSHNTNDLILSPQATPPTPSELADTLNHMVECELDAVSPTEWDENHISFLLVRSLRETLTRTTLGHQFLAHPKSEPCRLQLHAEAYKVSGDFEQTHGDIAVSITHDFGGYPVTGLGFYEAKAADLDHRYPAFRMRQLRRLTSATPRLSLLLYERTSMPVLDDEFAFPNRFQSSRSRARVRVLGANLASRFADAHTASFCAQSFGHQFVTRYLNGRDLDYSRAPAESLKRWLRATRRAPPLLVAVTLSTDKPLLPVPALPEYVSLPPPTNRLLTSTTMKLLT